MKKTTRRNITQNATLEALVTPEARRQAESLGVPLATYVGRLAADAQSMPVTINVPMADIKRINSFIGGGRVHEWIEGVVRDVVELEAEDMEMAAKN